jgi:predicted transposase YbfD/YdcC
LTCERFNKVVRADWGAENRLHWRLDVVMNEDHDRSSLGEKGSLRGKIKRAGRDEAYLARLLTLF